MADIIVHNGFKGKVTMEIDGEQTTISGLSSFTIGADERATIDVPTTFGTERDQVIIQQKGAITFSGSGFTVFDDAGQNALIDAYNDETELTTVKFWVDDTNYYQAKGGSENDFIRISSIGEVTTDATGFASFDFSGYFFDDYERQTNS